MREPQFLSEVGIVRVLRYGYCGMLFALLSAAIEPKAVALVVNALGMTFMLLATLGIGASIYAVHRHIVIEVFLYPALQFIHCFWDKIRQSSGKNSTNPVAYLRALGVEQGYGRAAYFAVRGQFFEPNKRERLDIVHSELHMLWITASKTLFAAIYLAATGRQSLVLFAISILITLCATIADIRQHQLECLHLKIAERKGEVRCFLRKTNYLE